MGVPLGLRIAWDEDKAESNLRKHRVVKKDPESQLDDELLPGSIRLIHEDEPP